MIAVINLPLEDLPAVTADEMREVDRVAVSEFGLDLTRMMENAGRSLAELAVTLFRPGSVTVLAGTGGNGGGGLVAARHLANRGIAVEVLLASTSVSDVTARQLEILERMGIHPEPEPHQTDLVVDALIGYSLSGDPRGPFADLIRWTVDHTVLSLDIPSGLDASTGMVGHPTVMAAATMTLGLPKTGLVASPTVGELYLADISIPPAAYRAVGLDVPILFAESPIVRLR